ncbi:MAG: hypothetical protein KBD16_00310 [Candidatus Pacebacteria bacterium]|nr:hypothetical protein [Candidatus Paceibacterota bacterium]
MKSARQWWNGLRLYTKRVLSFSVVAASAFLLMVAVGLILLRLSFSNLWGTVSLLSGLLLGALSVMLLFKALGWFVEFENQIREAWHEEIRRQATPSAILTRLRRVHLDRLEPFTDRHGETFMLVLGKVEWQTLRVRGLFKEAESLSMLGYIEKRGHGCALSWQISPNGWRFLENLYAMPKRWSPEDAEREVSTAHPNPNEDLLKGVGLPL